MVHTMVTAVMNKRQYPLSLIERMVLAYTTCMEMCLNGYRTVGMGVTRAPRPMVQPGSEGIARSACCAAAPGSTIRTSCVRRTVSGFPLLFATAVSGFVSSRAASPKASVTLCVFCYPPFREGLGEGKRSESLAAEMA